MLMPKLCPLVNKDRTRRRNTVPILQYVPPDLAASSQSIMIPKIPCVGV